MQSPAAYTLPVKLLTSTNDFLMIGPSIPQSCLLTNNHTHKHTHTHCTNTLPHTSIMSFIKGSTCGLMDHCECHSHWRYCIKIPTKGFFYLWHLFFFSFLRNSMRCMNTPNDDVSQVQKKVPAEQIQQLQQCNVSNKWWVFVNQCKCVRISMWPWGCCIGKISRGTLLQVQVRQENMLEKLE